MPARTSRVELRQLQYFIAVAETLNFHKAADRLHVTQSSVSRQVQQLEQELGATLVVRDRKKVQLTEDGQRVAVKARKLLAAAAELAALGRGEKRVASLKVGVGIPLAKSIQPLVTEFARKFPNVDVQYQDIIFPGLQNKALSKGDIDVGILWPPVDRSRLCSERLFDEWFRVILPRTSPLARRPKLRFKDLANQVLILPDQTAANNRRVLQAARHAGVTLKVARTNALPHEAGAALVASGKGIYVLAGQPQLFPSFGRGIAAIPLDEPISLEVRLAWRAGETSPVILDFLETARRLLTDSPKPFPSAPARRG